MVENRELTAEDIFSADDTPLERVDVEEWGGHLFVRGLTGTERDAFEQSMVSTTGRGRKQTREVKLENLRASLVARCAMSSGGQRLFTDTDVVRLGRKSAAALDRVFVVASRLSGLSDDDVEEILEDFTEEAPASSTTS